MALVISTPPNIESRGSYQRNLKVCRCTHVHSRFDALLMNRPSKVTSNKVGLEQDSAILWHSRGRFLPFEKYMTFARSPSTKMVLNGYVREDNSRNKIYTRLDSCLVITPPKGKKPCAIIKFLGGAFVGAVPEVTYG